MNTRPATTHRNRRNHLRETTPRTPLPPRSPLSYAGGDPRNPYIAFAVTCLSWVAAIGLIVALTTSPPSIRDSTSIKYLISAGCFSVVGYQSASRRAWPAAILLWFLAFLSAVAFFRF